MVRAHVGNNGMIILHDTKKGTPPVGWSTGHKAPRWAAGRMTGLPRPRLVPLQCTTTTKCEAQKQIKSKTHYTCIITPTTTALESMTSASPYRTALAVPSPPAERSGQNAQHACHHQAAKLASRGAERKRSVRAERSV
eukprot:5810452-Pyramimonas_sp.AAC.1